MNQNSRFDDMARTLASPIPRRRACAQILRGLAVAALASVSGPGAAFAGNKTNTCKRDKDCGNNRVCCHKVCCGSGQTCSNNQCKTPATKHHK